MSNEPAAARQPHIDIPQASTIPRSSRKAIRVGVWHHFEMYVGEAGAGGHSRTQPLADPNAMYRRRLSGLYYPYLHACLWAAQPPLGRSRRGGQKISRRPLEDLLQQVPEGRAEEEGRLVDHRGAPHGLLR